LKIGNEVEQYVYKVFKAETNFPDIIYPYEKNNTMTLLLNLCYGKNIRMSNIGKN
jgi:hypothetical protein